ncbi:MAG TPA: thermonuclease family protein [Gammaproteobacteria bacterium]|nr:thermonuclease family protein [Gammaproteobacteria bacterium]
MAHVRAGAVLLAAVGTASAATPCPAAGTLTAAVVRHVIDGDTVVLADGRHLRLVGIDAMELGHAGASDQPYSQEARRRLSELLAQSDGRVGMEIGNEAYDVHGRMLAYLYSPSGADLGQALLVEGLAVLIAEPPDVERLTCYGAAERSARSRRLGIWSVESPLVQHAADAAPAAGVFLILEGKVTDVQRRRAGLGLILEGRIKLWIDRRDLARFGADPAGLLGHKVLTRGWVRDYKGSLEIGIHAPQALPPLP